MYANKSHNIELTAKMLWAKNHKDLVDQYKANLGAIPITSTKLIKDQQK